jgi:hypothetical protein
VECPLPLAGFDRDAVGASETERELDGDGVGHAARIAQIDVR